MIRKAEIDDVHILVAMALDMHAESPRYRDKSFDFGLMNEFIKILIYSDEFCVFVSEKEGKITGMIAGSVSTFHFSLVDKYAADVGFYVKPEHRGGGAVIKLIKAYEEWAESRGVKQEDITLGVSCENKKLGEMLGKMGYNQSGELYRKQGRI